MDMQDVKTPEEGAKTKKSEEKTSRWRERYRRAEAFFNKNYAMFFAPIIAFVAYMVSLYVYRVFPFSDEYTAASYDLSAQICPFIEHLFDVLNGKSSLSYSYAILGGVDVTGTFLYFFISPFSFLFLIFGEGMVAQASGIVMACKLAAISVAGTWFAKKLFKGIPDYLCILIGLVYTYCGYTFVANTYINWMDFLLYLPFTVGAFKKMVKTGGFWTFAVLVACCIYTCFSIACFSMFIAFPALVFYGLLCVEKEKRHRYISRLCLAFVAAVLMALPVLLPALAAYLKSGRGVGLFDEFWYGFEFSATGEIVGFDGETFWTRFERETYRKWSYILTESSFVVLTLIWFCRRGLKDKFAQFMLVGGVMTLVPVLVDEATLLMNMGSYMSYALRFGFLNALYFLGGACLALEGLCFKPRCAYDGMLLPALTYTLSQTSDMQKDGGMSATNDKKKERNVLALAWNDWKKSDVPYKVCTGVIAMLGIAATVFILWFASSENYVTVWSNFVSDESWLSGFKNLAPSFAHSTGGLEMVAVLAVVVGIVIAVGAILAYKKKIGLRLLSFVLVLVVGAQVLFYNNLLVVGNRSTQHTTMGDFSTVSAQLNELETDENGELAYFRVKDYNDKTTANAPFTANFNSFSVFSSVIDADNFSPFYLFGYKGNGKNSMKSAQNGGSSDAKKYSALFGDSFLGYKYFIVHKDGKETVEALSYVRKVEVDGEHLQSGNFYAYENTAVFPLAFRVNTGGLRFEYPNDVENSTYRTNNQKTLFSYLYGREQTTETVEELSAYLRDKAAEIEVGAGKITAHVWAQAGEDLFLSFAASVGYTVTVNGRAAELVENDLHFLCVALDEGENVVEFVYHTPYLKYALIGVVGAIVGLCALAFIDRKTRFFKTCAPVISWTGIALATGVIVFFMLFPSVVFAVKLIALAL